MSDSRRVNVKRIKSILALRMEADDRVGSKASILGSMIGLKVRANRLTEQLGITYFVHEKIPRQELSPQRRVPTNVRVRDTVVTTDVLEWPRMAEQSLPAGSIIYDGRLQGTLSCFAASRAGYFGVSCAHCLVGVDRNPATPTAIDVYSKADEQFRLAGKSVYLTYSPGQGISGDFGYLDCGLFDLRDKGLAKRAAKGQTLSIVRDIRTLIGRRLTGISTLNAPNSSGNQRQAIVLGVEAQALDERSDLVLSVEPPGTFVGDSGMLWMTDDGRVSAIHARGEVMPSLQGSRLTTAMSAKRISESLSVQLVLG